MKKCFLFTLALIFCTHGFSQIEITSVDVIHESCFNANDGEIIVNVANTTGEVFFDIGFSPQSSNVFTNLVCGPYPVMVYDMAGSVSEDVEVNCASEVTAWVDPYPATFGNCDGMAYVYASGGTPPYTYTFSESPDMSFPIQSGPQPDIYGLCGYFTYYVTVTDANGCGAPGNGSGSGGTNPDWVISFDIWEMTPIITNVNILQNSCEGMCNGQAFVEVQGGTPPYTITNPNGGMDIPFNESITLTDMCPGVHTLSIYDGFGQYETVIITIEETIITPNVTATNESSLNACDGTITSNPTGGEAPYNYVWNTCPESTSTWNGSDINNLCSGNYQVTITDANGCATTSNCVTVGTFGCEISSTATVIEETCPGLCLGTVEITVPTGAPPFILSYDGNDYPFTSNYILNNLCDGQHQYSIRDDLGCITSGIFEILEIPLNIIPTASDESSPGSCDGTLSVDLMEIGGQNPYTINWFECGTSTVVGNTADVDNVCPGIYEVYVMDDRGCTAYSQACVTVGGEICNLSAEIALYHAPCTENSCSGEVDITPVNGTGPFLLSFEGNEFPFTYNYILSNLCDGFHDYQITDANGCVFVNNFEVMLMDVMIADPVATDETVPGACDGTVSVDPVSIGGEPPYMYTWHDCSDFTIVGADEFIPTLCPGQYSVIVEDMYGCMATSECITINGSSAGLNELLNDSSTQIYPNPFGSSISITSEHIINTLTIFDATGKTITSHGGILKNSLTVPTEDIEPGTYLVEIKTTKGITTRKRIIKL